MVIGRKNIGDWEENIGDWEENIGDWADKLQDLGGHTLGIAWRVVLHFGIVY